MLSEGRMLTLVKYEVAAVRTVTSRVYTASKVVTGGIKSMKKKLAFGTIGLMVLLAVGVVSWGQDGPAPNAAPGQPPHSMADGGHGWGDGPRRFDGGHRFAGGPQARSGGERWGGPGEHRMGMHRGGRPGFGGGHGFGHGGGLARMAENPRVREYLGLTDDQVKRLHTLGVEAEKASVQTRADMQLRHIELRELMRADNPDQSAIMAKIDEVNALRGKMEKDRVQTMLSARGVLTPDQIKKLKTFMENRGAGGMGHGPMERRGGPGRPPAHSGAAAPKPATPPAQ